MSLFSRQHLGSLRSYFGQQITPSPQSQAKPHPFLLYTADQKKPASLDLQAPITFAIMDASNGAAPAAASAGNGVNTNGSPSPSDTDGFKLKFSTVCASNQNRYGTYNQNMTEPSRL